MVDAEVWKDGVSGADRELPSRHFMSEMWQRRSVRQRADRPVLEHCRNVNFEVSRSAEPCREGLEYSFDHGSPCACACGRQVRTGADITTLHHHMRVEGALSRFQRGIDRVHAMCISLNTFSCASGTRRFQEVRNGMIGPDSHACKSPADVKSYPPTHPPVARHTAASSKRPSCRLRYLAWK